MLAAERRASPSTQRQALNALVFLYERALGRPLGQMDFQKSYPKRRMPTVLSREECAALMRNIHGTTKLMAQLMYGAGPRLMELLRLRVQDLDLARGQVCVRQGKGDRDRMTVLPELLHRPLADHLDRLRTPHTADREAELPGVWLPEGLARKWPSAGIQWQWQWVFRSKELSL